MTTVRNLPNDSHNQPVNYCSYLVRLWRTQHEVTWRASVQHVQTGDIIRFADIESLCRYLQSHVSISCAIQLEERAISAAEPCGQTS